MVIETLEKRKFIHAPNLRFKEFNEEWNIKSLNEITKINQGLQIAISERFTEPIEGGNFYITNEFLREGAKKKYYIKNASKSVLCDDDDILMTRTGNTGQIVTGVTGAFHNNFFKIKYSKECSKWFLFYFLNSHKTQHIILKLAGTSTIPDLNHSDFYKIKINLPSLPEQQKIASFLSAVDKKIQQLTRKKELMETYKKGAMQQLFSQEIRFKDPEGKDFPNWEKKSLNNILISYRLGGNYTNTEAVTDSPLIKMGNLGRGKINLKKMEYIPIEEQLDQRDKLEFGDLLFNTRNTLELVGKVSIWQNELPVAYYNSNLMYFKFENNFFMNYRLNSYDGIKALKRFATGTTSVAAIYTKDLLKVKLQIPSFEEQQKIADFLSALDKKIEAVSQQIEKMQGFKKGLLQQMFV